MKFSKGQVVVHPQHGPATISQISTRTLKGTRKQYLKLTVHDDDMWVAVPVDLAEEMGVRPVLDAAGITEIFELLVAESEPFDQVWSRRFKNYTERLRSGDIRTLAGLIRDLTRRNDEKKVSYGEASLLREAVSPFVAELAIVLALPSDEVEVMVDAAVRQQRMPDLRSGAMALAS